MNRLSVFALAFAGANASLLHKRQGPSDFDDHVSDVCSAVDESGNLDMNMPCNQIISIQYECMFGPKGGDLWRNASPNDDDSEDDSEDLVMLPNETQRVCICQSQHNDLLKGCLACQEAHGAPIPEDWDVDNKIQKAMNKYCDASTPAMQNYADAISRAMIVVLPNNWDSLSSPESTTNSDPIGTSTDVSLYYTPSVTGTPAYVPVLPTAAGNGSNITYTSSKTSGGLIVPTASVSEQDKGSSGKEESSGGGSSSSVSSSETAISDGGALQTAMTHPGALGALGFAAMIAAL